MQKTMECGGVEVLLDTPEEAAETVLIFVPGVSGKGKSDRFAPLVALALEQGMGIARFDLWDSPEELNRLTIHDIHSALTRIAHALVAEGFTRIITVGKSLGGGLVLTFEHPAVVQKIVWAPAFGCDAEGNMDEVVHTPLGTFASTREVRLGKGTLGAIGVPVGIVHGTADDAIPIENSRMISGALLHGTLIGVPGADHSFKSPDAERALMDATRALLSTVS